MRETLNPERSRSVGLKEWFRTRGIELVLCDLDDTFIDTHKIFIDKNLEFCAFVKDKLSLSDSDSQIFSETLDRLDREVFTTHFVNPVRYAAIAKELTKLYQPRYGTKAAEVFQKGLPSLLKIYETVPEFLPGAEETLVFLKATGIDMAVVTHGNLAWSNLKIRELNLRRFFSHFWIADEDEFKTGRDWLSAITWQSGKKPENTLVIGDNVRGDIQAAHSIGVKRQVLIPSPWCVYAEGETPEGTIVVPRINQLIDFLLDRQ